MQKQNVSEYKAVRQELRHVRNCMTRYFQLVMLATGPAFWLLASKASEKDLSSEMSFAAVLFANMSMLTLFILSYKVTSHNRYAGYSKLLGHERFLSTAVLDSEIFLWEICIDILRALDCADEKIETFLIKCEYPENAIPGISNLRAVVEPYSGPAPEKDSFAWLKGWGLLLSWSRESSGSWKLPVYHARIFGAINLAFVFFAVRFLVISSARGKFQLIHYTIISLLIVLFALWSIFVAKLHKQMLGSETVEAFCCKFLPIRAQLLRELNPDIGYSLMGVSTVQPVVSENVIPENSKQQVAVARKENDFRLTELVAVQTPLTNDAGKNHESEDVRKAG